MDNIYSKVFRLSTPTIVGLIIQALYQVLNAYFVGFLGVSQLATINLTYPLTFFLIALGQSIGIGTAGITSRSIGLDRFSYAGMTATNGLLLAIAAAGAYLVFIFFNFDSVARTMGVCGDTAVYFSQYGKPILAAFLFVVINTVFGFIARSEGGTFFSMVTLIIAFALNAIFDPIFIFWFDLGIKGAAYATLLAQILSVTAYIYYFFHKKSCIRIHFSMKTANMNVCLKILSIGIPTLTAFMINVLAIVLVNRRAAAFGKEAVAGIGIALRLYTVSALPVMGLVNGVQSLIGAYVVDRNPAGIQNLIKALLKIGAGYGGFVTAVFLLFSRPVATLFSHSPAVVTVLSQTVMIYTALFLMVPVQLISLIFEQSRGNVKLAMYVSFARQGIYLIPLLLVLPPLLGINGIAASQLISDFIAGSTCIYILWRELFRNPETKAVSGAVETEGNMR